MILGADLLWLFRPITEFTFDAFRQGGLPLWNPHLFLGFPQYAEPQLSTFYPIFWLFSFMPVEQTFSWLYALHFGLTAAGGYLLARRLGAQSSGSFLAGIVLGFNGFMMGHLFAGHLPHVMTIAYLPWLLVGAHWACTWPRSKIEIAATTMVAAVPLALAMLAGYAPFFPFLVAAVSLMMVWLAAQAWQRGERQLAGRIMLQWVGLGLFSGLLAAVQLLPTAQFTILSSRLARSDYASISAFYMPFWGLLTLIFPDIFGVPDLYTLSVHTVDYWADSTVIVYWEAAVYIGILPLLLWTMAWFIGKREWCFWGIIAVAGLILALGPLAAWHRVFYQLVPGFGLFRVPARLSYFFLLSAAMATGLMFDRWYQLPASLFAIWRKRLIKGLFVVLPILFTFILLAWLLQGVQTEATSNAQVNGIVEQMVRLVLLLSASVALLVWGYGRSRWQLVMVATLILLVDLWGHGGKFVDFESSAPEMGWVMADLALPHDRADFRVDTAYLPENQGLLYGFRHLSGYDDFRLETSMKLAEMAKVDSRISRLLGVRYLLYGDTKGSSPSEGDGWYLLTSPAGATIYERKDNFPTVFMTHDVWGAVDEAESLELMAQSELDFSQTAVVQILPDTNCHIEPGNPIDDRTVITEYTPDKVTIQVEAAATGWLVLNDLNYPGWQATVDGNSVPIQPTNYALRGICVPAGAHEVVFQFQPVMLIYGAVISGTAILLLVIIFLLLIVQKMGKISDA